MKDNFKILKIIGCISKWGDNCLLLISRFTSINKSILNNFLLKVLCLSIFLNERLTTFKTKTKRWNWKKKHNTINQKSYIKKKNVSHRMMEGKKEEIKILWGSAFHCLPHGSFHWGKPFWLCGFHSWTNITVSNHVYFSKNQP